jgi:IrrE N-terminal-like domain
MRLQPFIDRLEVFAERRGAPVIRGALGAAVQGRAGNGRLVLRAGLTKEQQLLTLVHELTHLLVHCEARPRLNRTVCEYEAEAVEKWVGMQLGLPAYSRGRADPAGVPDGMPNGIPGITDDLLKCSVVRVRWAARILLRAATAPERLQTQAAIEVDTPPGEEIVLDDELGGMGDFIGIPEPF